ncbi:SpoIIE family protein phosphatase [Anaerolineales bacterium HSG24]|nr:SpoIIE family protein phosphatase [Anaerolineales bacterium HSG24]
MIDQKDKLIHDLTVLNQIAENLNRAHDVQTALNNSLPQLVTLLNLETAWVFIKDPTAHNRWAGRGYRLIAGYNLPPALALDSQAVWGGGCSCQSMCDRDELNAAYNEVRCSRLAEVGGDYRGLLHASAPLRSRERIWGILNVAVPSWDSFTPETLALLTNVGSLMGITLERAKLFDMLQEQHILQQAALLNFSNQLLSRLDLNDLMTYLTKEVRSLLDADACAIILPADDPTMLTYRATSGWLVDPIAENRQIPVENTLSGLVMQTQRPMVIEDLQVDDPTSWSSTWFLAEAFRGHAVVPLIAEEKSIGVLIVNRRQPHLFEETEVHFLRLMANQAALAIEKARLHQVEIQRERLAEELIVGQKIQQSLLPEFDPEVPGWEFATVYQPARSIGGDYYDFFELPGQPKRLGLVIADVSGKGVAAALFMSLSRSIIRTKAMTGTKPTTAIKRANRLIVKDSRSDMFLTAFYAMIEVETGQLTYTRAGHNFPLWLSQGDDPTKPTLHELTGEGIVIGAFEQINLSEETIQIAHGDLIVFYTDGITEAMNTNREMFGEKRLEAIILANPHVTAQQMLTLILEQIADFIGDTPQSDDFTMVVIKRSRNL